MKTAKAKLKSLGQIKIELVLFSHVLWVLFIYSAWPFIFTHANFNKFYFAWVLITLVARAVFKGDCFLTNVENNLRKKYDPGTVYNDTDKCLPYYSGKWMGFRIEKPVITSVFSALFLLSLFLLLKNIFIS